MPNGHDGREVVGGEQYPDAVKYVPGGHGRGVEVTTIRLQEPSGCRCVPYGQDGLGVVGVEQIPDPVKKVPGGHDSGVAVVSILIQLPSG